MLAIQTWIGRLSTPAMLLLHVVGGIIGVVSFFILAAIAIGIFEIKDVHTTTLIVLTFLLLGATLPILLLSRARNNSLRSRLPPPLPQPLQSERLASTPLPANHGDEASTEVSIDPASATIWDQRARHAGREYVRHTAETSRTKGPAAIYRPEHREVSPTYNSSDFTDVKRLLEPSPRRWRWWYTLSTILSVVVILACFLPS